MTKQTKDKKPPAGKGPAYKRWYNANKEAFNARRREKYAADPTYRQTAKDQANASRRRVPMEGPPASHPYTFDDVADHLSISTFSLRDWRRRSYFPQPHTQNSRLYFSAHQVRLLEKMQEFLSGGGARRPAELETMKNTVFMNWGI